MTDPAPDSSPSPSWEKQPLEWPRASGQADRLLAALAARQKQQRRRRVVGLGGGIALLALASLLWRSAPPATNGTARLETSSRLVVMAPQTQTLPDGTVVDLKPGAEITIDFSQPEQRRVALRRGEAHFQVAKNPERPFVVAARGVEFRALGTAFSVDLRARDVEMLVTEGRVAVRHAESAASTAVTHAADALPAPATVVAAGQRVVVPESRGAPAEAPNVVTASAAEIGERLAWRVPRVEFNESPLSAVVASLNQHSGRRLRLIDAELGRVAVSGVLRANNIEPLLQMLEANYRIRATRGADGAIELRRER